MVRRPPPRPRLSRLAIAGAGLMILAVGWRLAGAEPAGAQSLDATDEAAPASDAPADAPIDYVPDQGDAPIPVTIDPLAAADAGLAMAGGEGAPLQFLRVTSSFGMRRHPILGFSRMHQGVDFAAREGAPVLAAADGVVTVAGPSGGYGNLLRIRHSAGWDTGYAHLSRYAPGIAPGAPVERGEVVAFVGHTGLATGPHLHFEVSHNGVRLDPLTTPFGGAPAPGPGPIDPHAGGYAATDAPLRPAIAVDTPAA